MMDVYDPNNPDDADGKATATKFLPPGYGDEEDGTQVSNPNGVGAGTGVVAPKAAAPAPAPAGTSPFDRSKFMQDSLGANLKSSADMDSFLQTHPEYASSVKRQGNDIWAINDQKGGTEHVDAIFDQGGPDAHSQWTDPGMDGPGGSAPGGVGGAGGNGTSAPAGSVGAGAGGQGVYGTGNSQMDSAMHDALMGMLTRNTQPVTAADVKDKFGPVDAIYQRNAQESRNAAGERAAFQGRSVGGAGGSLDSEQNAITDKLAGDEGGLMAGLIGDEMTARRADVVNALQFAQGEEKIQLQKQLADMDHDIAQQQVGVQSKSVDNQYQLGQEGLDQSDAHFYDNMDNQNALQQYTYDQIFGQNLAN